MDIASMTAEEISEMLNEKPYRGKQIFNWLHARQAASFEGMTDLPKRLRRALASGHIINTSPKTLGALESADQTTKYLFQLENNTIIESVHMNYSFGGSVCVSTQAGCRMGCVFCASGKGGLERNLTASEMCGQVYAIQREKPRVGRVVLMGCGEPLDNYENVARFIRLISDENGQNIGRRHITVSTCGLAPQIVRLADEAAPVGLAVSLHAPNDAIRERLAPASKAWPMRELMAACAYFSEKTKRQVTFGYTMVEGVNDSLSNAAELCGLLKGTLSHVNLIRLNGHGSPGLRPSTGEAMRRFAGFLAGRGVKATIRRPLGAGVNAACGQLRGATKLFNG